MNFGSWCGMAIRPCPNSPARPKSPEATWKNEARFKNNPGGFAQPLYLSESFLSEYEPEVGEGERSLAYEKVVGRFMSLIGLLSITPPWHLGIQYKGQSEQSLER